MQFWRTNMKSTLPIAVDIKLTNNCSIVNIHYA